ncbi:MAG: hypothetical protein WAQ51_09025 [Candidatus Microthrix parvicella]
MNPQERRYATNDENAASASAVSAAGDLRNDRIGMLVVSHHVGEPMTTRPKWPVVTTFGTLISRVALRICAGSILSTSVNPLFIGNFEKFFAQRLSVSSIFAVVTSQPPASNVSVMASVTRRACWVYV